MWGIGSEERGRSLRNHKTPLLSMGSSHSGQNELKDNQNSPSSQVWDGRMAKTEMGKEGTLPVWGTTSLMGQEGDTVSASKNPQPD